MCMNADLAMAATRAGSGVGRVGRGDDAVQLHALATERDGLLAPSCDSK